MLTAKKSYSNSGRMFPEQKMGLLSAFSVKDVLRKGKGRRGSCQKGSMVAAQSCAAGRTAQEPELMIQLFIIRLSDLYLVAFM